MDTRRVEALADGVFAIAMTLLVLEVHVPELADPVTGATMLAALGRILPNVGGYVVSFIILGMIWIGHHNQFHFIRRVDRALLWINIFYLLCVAFVPFATAFLTRYPLRPASLLIYGGTLLLGGVSHFIHWNHAVSHGLVSDEVTPEVVELFRERISMGIAVYLAATLVGAFLPKVGLVLFACMPVLYMLPGRIDPALVEAESGTNEGVSA
jgi:uncharacterized membrane protein